MRRCGTKELRRWALLAVVGALCASPTSAQELTVDEVIARTGRAMGGSPRLEALRTVRFQYRTERGPVVWEIVRPDLVLKEREGEFVLLFDGERAGFLEGSVEGDGSPPGPHLVPQEDWHHFEIDIALYVPAFFDFPAEYEGQHDLDGRPAHVVRVTLPMGGMVIYHIDAESWLPVGVDVPDWGLEQRFGDFRQVGGFVYPHRFWFASNPQNFLVLDGLQINTETDAGRFVFPEGIR